MMIRKRKKQEMENPHERRVITKKKRGLRA
jgi:hypothetical protein